MNINPANSSQLLNSLDSHNTSGSTPESTNNDTLAGYESVSSTQLGNKPKYELTISDEAILKAIEKVNKAIMGEPRQFEYSVHKATGVTMVKVVNTETKEVIREFPPEKILDLIDKLQELCGLIIDEKR